MNPNSSIPENRPRARALGWLIGFKIMALGIIVVLFGSTAPAQTISVNQHPTACQDNGTANSLKCSFASNTTAGNFIWVSASAYPGNNSSNPNCTVSDDGSDSFKPATGNGQHTSGGGWLYIWGAQVATAGKGVTVACTPASGHTMYITLDIFELTNGSPATWTFPDTGNSASQSGGTNLSVASFTPSNNNEMVLVVASNDSNASFTAGSNFTLGSSITTGQGIGTEYWVQSTATATTAPFTQSSSANWAEVASSVSAGGGGQAPSINNLSPTSGPVGTSVTISGTNFGSSQGSSTVKFNGMAATPTSWSSTSIVVPVPNGATTGNVVVTVNGTASNGVNFTVTSGSSGITVDQHPTACQDDGTANSLKCSFASNTTVGNFIWVSASAYPGNNSSNPNCTVSDDGSDSFKAATGNGQPTAGGGWLYIWGAQVATAGKGVTVACTPASGHSMYITLDIFELTNGSPSTWTFPDTGNSAAHSGGTNLSVASFTPSNNNEMVLVVAGNDSNASFTAGTNFTLGSNITTGEGMGTEYWVQSTATATTAPFTETISANWAELASSVSAVGPPSISSLTPSSGAVGSAIVIAGSNFGSTQGNGGVSFNGTAAAIRSWSNTSITAAVPAGASTGNVVVTAAGGVASGGVSFTVVPAPAISSLAPSSGAVGSSIIIAGTNFGATQGNGGVTFSGTTATISSWSDTSVTATVPTGVVSGNVVVTAAGGVASTGVLFTVVPPPSVTGLTPNSGAVRTSVVIAGTNFGSTQGNGLVTFNGTIGPVTSWSNTSITAYVPTGATTGNVVVTAAGGVASNGVSFTVVAAPSITSLTPNSGATGSSVVIAGSGFGSTQGNGGVSFSGTAASISSWSNTSITVVVPAGINSSNVVVTASGGANSGGVSFTVVPPPGITTLSPTSGAIGSSVVIAGTNFGLSQGNGSVTFHGTTATVSSWSNTSVTAVVPTGATTGNVVVTAAGGVGSTGVSFTVSPAPTISSLSPNSAAIGASVTIAGANFGASQGNGGVTFNGTTAAVTSWNSGSITATVPANATTGNVVVTAAGGIASPGVTFTVTPSPNISSLSPSSGVIGNSVTITGTNFGSSQGNSTVTFNGIQATATAWSSTSITAAVPTGARSGSVVVTAAGVPSNAVNFTVNAQMTGLSPASGPVGTVVTITGNNFGSTQGSSTLTFGLITAFPTSWSDTKIIAPVPNGVATNTQLVTVTVASAGSSQNFNILPAITSISPSSGAQGAAISITGTSFGASNGIDSFVTFNNQNVAATPTAWSDTQIVVTVPSGAATGNINVTSNGAVSNGVNFTLTSAQAPGITSLSPASGALGSSVTISGEHFGSSQGSVTFNGTTATIVSWSNGSITATVPSAATTGNVVVTAGGVASNGVNFTVVAAPNITSLSPNSGAVGISVTINGAHFGTPPAVGTISFNGVAAQVTTWTDAYVITNVPATATTGNVVLTAAGGVGSNAVNFTVLPTPGITSLSPASGAPGWPVTITGTNFGASQGSGVVTFNGVSATVTSWSNTSIGVTVPNGATTGNVVVTANDGGVSNGISFAVLGPYTFSVSYAPNGDVLSANDSVNGNWTYTYDDFNRLSTAVATNGQGCQESYDQYGNRWRQQPFPAGTNNTCFASSLSFTGNNTTNNNRIDGSSYDAAGNLLNDGSHSYTYDAENRIIKVDNGQTATYTYDANGQRIRKVSSAGTADFLYDLGGHVITEVSGSGAWNRGEVYAGGRHVSTYSNGTTYFIQADWLGSERARTTVSGGQCETITNLPFGDGQATNGDCGDPSPNHLTGKPRDTEDNLDYFGARYFSSSMGRWATPDWAAKATAVPYANFGDPQSLNLYSYVKNNPVSAADADGHVGWDGGASTSSCLSSFQCTDLFAIPHLKDNSPPGWFSVFPVPAREEDKSDEDNSTGEAPQQQQQPQQQQPQPAVQVVTNQYAPDATGTGVNIQVTATVAQNNTYVHYNWVQMITTNDPTPGNPANVAYVDRDPGQTTSYYWNPQEQAQHEQMAQAQGASTIFSDHPTRVYNGGPAIVWNAHLALVGIRPDGHWHTLRTIGYGFTIDANGVRIQPLRIPY